MCALITIAYLELRGLIKKYYHIVSILKKKEHPKLAFVKISYSFYEREKPWHIRRSASDFSCVAISANIKNSLQIKYSIYKGGIEGGSIQQ